jgi:hypothetical protein
LLDPAILFYVFQLHPAIRTDYSKDLKMKPKEQNRRELMMCMLMQYYSVNHKWRRTAWESLCVEFIRLGLSLGRQETQRIALYGSQVILQRQVFSRVLALTVILGRVNPSSSVDSRCFSKFSALAAEQRSLRK